MATRIGVSDLAKRVGEELGVSEWLEVTQERIDRFAEATGDHQWIHIDAARAAVESATDGLQVTWGVTIEREGQDKPCVVLDWKVRYYPA